MKPKTLLAGFAWLNWYAITWLILFSSTKEWFNSLGTGLAWLIFLFIAMIATFAKEQTK